MSNLYHYLYIFLLILNFISFFYSSLYVFKNNKTNKMLHRLLLRGLILTCWIAAPVQLIYLDPSSSNRKLSLFASLLGLISLVLFWISARHIKDKEFKIIFNKEQPDLHLNSGPYRYVRHPFYTAYILCYASLLFATPSYLIYFLSLSIVIYYVYAAHEEEKNFLNSPWSESYKAHQEKTGMFFPKLKSLF